MRVQFACFILGLTLLGCDSKPRPEQKESAIDKALSTQFDSLEKAKSVEQQLKENAELREQQIKQRGG